MHHRTVGENRAGGGGDDAGRPDGGAGVTASCTRCATPVGSTDRACPVCGAPVARPAAPPPAGRRLILDDPGPAPPPGSPAPRRATVAGGVRGPRPARSDRGPAVVGTVTGEIDREHRAAGGPGRRAVVVAAAVVAVVALLVLVIAGGLRSPAPVLVALLVLGGLPPLLAAATVRRGADAEPATEVRRLRVTEATGRVVDCVLSGELRDAPPLRGDVVEVYGRDAGEQVRVRELVVVADRRVVTARPGLRYRVERATAPLAVGLAAACALGVAAVLLAG